MTWYPGAGDDSYFYDGCIAAMEYSGVSRVSPLDAEASNWGGLSEGRRITTAEITTANPHGHLIGFGAFGAPIPISLGVFSAGAGWNERITAGGCRIPTQQ